MPELPEVETVRQGLLPAMKGKILIKLELNRKNLRFDFDDDLAKRLEAKHITDIGRRSKYLLMHFASAKNKQTLIGHLGMSGKFTIFSHNEAKMRQPQKHDHVVFYLDDGTAVVYNDPRRFGFMLLADDGNWQTHKLIRDIGPEPLTSSFDAAHLATKSSGKKTNIKNHLLNQKIVAGLGNIYVCEALFRAKINPTLPASILATKAGKPSKICQILVPIIKDILQEAIAAGGSTLNDYRQADGNLGYFQHRFAAYGREGKACTNANCGDDIARIVQSGRSTFYCPSCQR
ncbi:MAG: bifunctional DNA-formamidopyrimidine glycosylase/DNA-(apurinic or apyrimidinic site) lyase [Rhizobiales bacterium]|nr:bifunctional DNA-formamidopyrimidine glycosylase/DNA-(apurinic or apyrimidinic site) lyase [Hyphomicrobiales bacterium]NRB14214.1 bifunctional DNA-formamidopyrimidine glycosylase/DNA-(apurinic or apyrimidinic site) lyase [Hyphomicrobiales bacterium]